ncbi:MAG TPA: toxic anion resistance protein [Bdellovibrionales bacterium]|nr:toxic anion resistance protein [Bdellovibrionales bacterium]
MKTNELTLQVPDPVDVKKEVAVALKEADPALESKADQFVQALMQVDPTKMPAVEESKQAVETMGADLQKKAAHQSRMLEQPLRDMSRRSEEGSEVSNALVKLKMEVEALDPNKFDFSPGWFSRLLGFLPFVGTPLKRYFTKYESAQTVIAAIVSSLEKGKEQLERDNITLKEDQKAMREMAIKLDKAVKLGQIVDQKIQHKLDRELQAGDPKHKFVSEEILFPLRQRIIDLQTQLAVQQQGVLASELIVRNNQELVRGVGRALHVTVSALQVAVTVALALENQKIVLDKIEMVNKTTSDLIAGTAARLKTQGTAIHKQASSSMVDMNALKAAFADIEQALQDISRFKTQALPQMASTVLELHKLSERAESTIREVEEGSKQRAGIKLEIES